MGSDDAVLHIEQLSRRFGSREVIRDLSLTLEKGDRVALRGANGSGKTTILRCVAGTLSPTRGQVLVGGHHAGTIEARCLIGASIAQERSFYSRLDGHKNLLIFARLRDITRNDAERQVHALEDELDIRTITSERVDKCSSGMLQQLAFGRSLLGQPKLLILDEPTRSMDKEARARFWSAIERRPRLAVLIATHDDDDVTHCTDEIALAQASA